MFKRFPWFLSLLVVLPLGACGGDGTDAVPSVSGVFPPQVFLGRTTEVLVSGSGTNWTEGTSLDFGPGVTVDEVAVSSPSALYATITIAPDAESGARDVTVTGEDATVTLTGAFRLDSPISLDSVQGTLAQGSIALVTLKNEDLLNPFDTTSTGDGFFEPIRYTNIMVDAPEGVRAQATSVSLYKMTVQLLIDVEAASGPMDVTVYSGPAEDTLTFVRPGALDVEERAAVELSPGTAETGMITKPLESHLFALNPSELSIQEVEALAAVAEVSPQFILLGPSGTFGDLLFQASSKIASDEVNYLVLLDASGAAGYEFTLDSSAVAASSVAHAEPNDTHLEAQAATAPAVLQGADLADGEDVDWIKVTIAEGDTGKTLNAFTDGGDPLTDTVITVYIDDPGEESNLIVDSGDDDFHEEVSAVLEQAGEYYVKVSPSPEYFNPARNSYEAAVYLVE